MEWKFLHLYKFVIGEDEFADPEFDYDFSGSLETLKISLYFIVFQCIIIKYAGGLICQKN